MQDEKLTHDRHQASAVGIPGVFAVLPHLHHDGSQLVSRPLDHLTFSTDAENGGE